MTTPQGFFLCSEGDLIPARGPYRLVRPGFARHHRQIDSGRDFRETLRGGAYAWPGGYPLYFIMYDGEALSFAAARENAKQIIRAIRDNDHSGWHAVGCDVNYEDELYCAHTGHAIESAYGTA